MNNVTNQVPFLRTSRDFPDEIKSLSYELDKTYIDIANCVNNRVIGLYPTNRPGITGESFYLINNSRQQTLRQVFTFTTTASITHGIKVTNINQFTKCSGSFTNGTASMGLIYASTVAIAGQITFYITTTQIVFLVGAGAPALTNGRIILEWLSET
jgi:hypothetical protein